MKTKTTVVAIGGLLALLLAALACFNTNPYQAGEASDGSLKPIPHTLRINGVGHADGICDPVNFCSACHGASLQGGTSGEPSCTQCHGTVWTNANCGKGFHTVNMGGHLHAPEYCKAEENCTGCHGEDLRGGTNGQPSCYSCHDNLWDSANCGQNSHTVNLGGTYHAPNYCRPYQNCVGCHGAQLHGGTGGQPSCLQCHDQKNWMNCGSTQHNQSKDGYKHASGYCQPFDNCVFCHGNSLQGGPNGEPSCTACHGQKWNSADCGQNSHTKNLGGAYHAPNYCRPYQNCTGCHGAQLQGGSDGEPSCLKCHDPEKWMNCGTTQHSQSKDGSKHASGFCKPLDNCVFCHGDNLQGGPNGEPSCTECHGQKWNSDDCGDDLRSKR